MADWKYKLRIKEPWQAAKRGEIDLQELARYIVTGLQRIAIHEPEDDDLQQIIDDFQAVDEQFTRDDFDDVMENLYNWGDCRLSVTWPAERLCWIETF